MVSTSLIDCEELESSSRAILDEYGTLSDVRVAAFLEAYPLTKLFELLQSGLVKDSQLVTVSHALSKVFGSGLGVPVLMHADSSLIAATFHAVHPELRRLAVLQFSRLLYLKEADYLAKGASTDAAAMQHLVMLQLLETIQDPDTGVAAAAVKVVASWANQSPNAVTVLSPSSTDELGAKMKQLTGSKDSTVRLRAAGLLLEIMGGSSSSSSSSDGGGGGSSLGDVSLSDPLIKELSDKDDPLSCLAALGLLRELVEGSWLHADAAESAADSPGGSGNSTVPAHTHRLSLKCVLELCGRLFPLLMGMLDDELLSSGAMTTAVALMRRALELPPGQQQPSPQAVSHTSTLLNAMKAVLSDTGVASSQAEADVLDAAGVLAQCHAAASMLLEDKELASVMMGRAIGRSPHPDVRVAALHAVASAAGMERATQHRQRSEALLSAAAEENLRLAIYSVVTAGANNSARSPAEALWSLLQQPFPETRVAVYRFLAAMAFRTWFAADMVRCTPLIEHMLRRSMPAAALPDIATSASSNLIQWHYVCLTSLHATTQAALLLPQGDTDFIHVSTLQEVAVELHDLVRSGPYGSKLNQSFAEPQVATAQV